MLLEDSKLLAECAKNGGAEGFPGLVERHIDFVYAAALRQTGDPHVAQDITQAVFLLFLQRAGRLKAGTLVKGWLFSATRYVVANARRAETRRKLHEREAAAMRSEAVCEDHWPGVAPILDDALAELSKKDRGILLLRFFEDLPLAALGKELGISEQAAQKRTERALERLRHLLVGRGAAVAGASLGGILQAGVARAAPPHLARATIDLALNGVSASAQSSSAFSLAKGTEYFMAVSKIKSIAVIVVICLLVVSMAFIVFRYAPSILAQSTRPDPGVAASAPAAATTNIKSIYSLQNGEIFKRIVDVPPDLRKRFMEEQFPGGKGSVLFAGWSQTRYMARTYMVNPDYQFRRFVDFMCFARIMSGSEFEIDDALASLHLTGDIIFKQDATDDQLCAGLTTFIHNELGVTADVAFRDVPTKVIVLSGHWKYTPAPRATAAEKSNDPEARNGEPCIEIYSDKTLDPNATITSSSKTSHEHLSRNLSDALSEKVIFEADGLPNFMSIRSHGDMPGDASGRGMVFQHIQEQTGLRWTEETRPVHILFIETKKPAP
jgi:RNA polymerase sigma factor (sigma-70 family)